MSSDMTLDDVLTSLVGLTFLPEPEEDSQKLPNCVYCRNPANSGPPDCWITGPVWRDEFPPGDGGTWQHTLLDIEGFDTDDCVPCEHSEALENAFVFLNMKP